MMTDMAMTSHAASGASAERAAVLQRLRGGDTVFYWMTRIAAVSVLGLLGAIMISLIIGAWPALTEYGLRFLTTARWAPNAMPDPVLGGLSPLVGTLITSFVALLIAVPVGLGVATGFPGTSHPGARPGAGHGAGPGPVGPQQSPNPQLARCPQSGLGVAVGVAQSRSPGAGAGQLAQPANR